MLNIPMNTNHHSHILIGDSRRPLCRIPCALGCHYNAYPNACQCIPLHCIILFLWVRSIIILIGARTRCNTGVFVHSFVVFVVLCFLGCFCFVLLCFSCFFYFLFFFVLFSVFVFLFVFCFFFGGGVFGFSLVFL